MATLLRDFDDLPNQLEEGKMHGILQQCGRTAYSCFNFGIFFFQLACYNYKELATLKDFGKVCFLRMSWLDSFTLIVEDAN